MAPTKVRQPAAANPSEDCAVSPATARRTFGAVKKLPRIPQGAQIHKRPLARRQHPASSRTRIVYLSSSTPFMAAVKRVRKQLDGSAVSRGGGVAAAPAQKAASLHARIEGLKRGNGGGDDAVVVTVMGTGKALEKTLKVASFFEQQADCRVEVRTRTVGAVDDLIHGDGADGAGAEDESRVRRLGCLEVKVQLK